MAAADGLAATLASLADEAWRASGGPAGTAYRWQRAAHGLHLVCLGLSHKTMQLSQAGSGVGKSSQDALSDEGEVENDPVVVPFDPGSRLQPCGAGGFRRLRDAFVADGDVRHIRAAATAAMVQCFRRGGQTTLSLVPAVRERLDTHAYTLLYTLLERARKAAELDLRTATGPPCRTCGTPSDEPAESASGAAVERDMLHHRGALLIRLSAPEHAEDVGPACWGCAPHQPYWSPHIDQHNVSEYDVSALVYLTTHGEDFDGGVFAFHDAAADAVLRPMAGQLLTFSSGSENPHSVARVRSGVRLALACWFTRDASRAVELTPPLEPTESASQQPCSALWGAERSIGSAAACSLAANDPIQEALAEAQRGGWPMATVLERLLAEAGGATDPGAWYERAAARAAERPDGGGTAELLYGSADGIPPSIAALVAAARVRESAYNQLVQCRLQAHKRQAPTNSWPEAAAPLPRFDTPVGAVPSEATAAGAEDAADGFDVFDL